MLSNMKLEFVVDLVSFDGRPQGVHPNIHREILRMLRWHWDHGNHWMSSRPVEWADDITSEIFVSSDEGFLSLEIDERECVRFDNKPGAIVFGERTTDDIRILGTMKEWAQIQTKRFSSSAK